MTARAGVGLLVLLAGCTSAAPPGSADSDCPTPAVSPDGVLEVRADGGTVTGLVFGTLPARVGEDLKVVWRVTGDGDLRVRSERPDGSRGELVFGPERHGGSNFPAPGEEWGTGFRFDAAGCWRVELARDGVTASLAVPVIAAGRSWMRRATAGLSP